MRMILAACCAAVLAVLFMGTTASEAQKYDAVGFSGTGLMLPYHMGVLKALKEERFVPQVVKDLAGLSGGALIAASHCTKSSPAKVKELTWAMLEFCANDAPFYCYGKLDQQLSQFLEAVVPRKVQYKKCNKHLAVSVGRIQNVTGSCQDCVSSNLANKWVYNYRSRQDLIHVLRTTSFLVNGISSPSECSLTLRDKPSCDGGYIYAGIPCPTWSKKCVKVSAHVGPIYANVNIYPGMRGDETLPFPKSQWNSNTMNPVLINAHKDAIYKLGMDDAKYWLKNGRK